MFSYVGLHEDDLEKSFDLSSWSTKYVLRQMFIPKVLGRKTEMNIFDLFNAMKALREGKVILLQCTSNTVKS